MTDPEIITPAPRAGALYRSCPGNWNSPENKAWKDGRMIMWESFMRKKSFPWVSFNALKAPRVQNAGSYLRCCFLIVLFQFYIFLCQFNINFIFFWLSINGTKSAKGCKRQLWSFVTTTNQHMWWYLISVGVAAYHYLFLHCSNLQSVSSDVFNLCQTNWPVVGCWSKKNHKIGKCRRLIVQTNCSLCEATGNRLVSFDFSQSFWEIWGCGYFLKFKDFSLKVSQSLHFVLLFCWLAWFISWVGSCLPIKKGPGSGSPPCVEPRWQHGCTPWWRRPAVLWLVAELCASTSHENQYIS